MYIDVWGGYICAYGGQTNIIYLYDKITLYNLGWPGIHYEGQVGHELTPGNTGMCHHSHLTLPIF